MLKNMKAILGFQTSPTTPPKRRNRANSLRGNFITKYTHPIENDYDIDSTKPLGTGAFGVVVAGVNRVSSRPFAIKFINKFSHLARIEREIKLMTDIDHANVLRLFSVYDSDAQVAFVTERCTGGHLGELVKRTQPHKFLQEDFAKILIRQLVSAVAHIHSRGICHRDIKLQNVLLENMDSQHPQIKLIDFGFATRYVGVTPMKTRCGTPYATAPEVYRESYDERCDVWSVGVVSYYLLSGHRPFTAVELPGDLKNAGKAAMATNILMGRYHFNYPSFRNVSAEGISFIQKLLTVNYKHRCSAKDSWGLPWLQQKHSTTKFDFNSLKDKDTPLSMAVSNLRGKRESSVLGNTGMVAVAFHHSRNDAPELRSLFQTFDTENAGVLSKEAFRKAMKSVSPDLSPEEIDQLFAAIDVDDDKQISFTEFLAATMDPREVDMHELGKAFRLLDSDNKGYLTVDDFYRVLATDSADKQNGLQLSTRALSIKVNNREINLDGDSRQKGSSEDISKSGIHYDEDIDKAGQEREKAILLKKIAHMIMTADKNNDGVLSYSEFLVGIVGMDGGEVDYDENGDIDSSAAITLLTEQRDVFTHSSLAKGSEKMKIKSLLSNSDSMRGLTRSGSNLSDHSSPSTTPRAALDLKPALLTPPGSITKKSPRNLMKAATAKAQLEYHSDEEEEEKHDPDDPSEMLDMCSSVDVNMLGSFIRLQNPSAESSPKTDTPPKMKGPPSWIADKNVLAALNSEKGKFSTSASSSPLAAKRDDRHFLPPL